MAAEAEIIIIPADSSKPVRHETMEPTLKALQEIVGGYIEQVPVGPGLVMLANEDGMSMNLPNNARAGSLLQTQLLGTVVFVGIASGSDGDYWTNIPEGLWEEISSKHGHDNS